MAYIQPKINAAIKDTPPEEYLADVLKQCNGGDLKYGSITDKSALDENLAQNCIPTDAIKAGIGGYDQFLEERCVLMARKIKDYYQNL